MKTILKQFVTLCLFVLTLTNGFAAKKKKTIKVMSYNVHHCNPPSKKDGTIDLDAIAKVINAEKPDFVALQEIDVRTKRSGKNIDQAQALAEKTGMYAFFSKSIDHGGGDYGVAVLSKHPIIESIAKPLPVDAAPKGEPRSIAIIKAKIDKKRSVWFGSTHLDLREPNRLKQAHIINDFFKNHSEPVIIAGDFNATPESNVMATFYKEFDNTCTQCLPTFPEVNPREIIDYILTRKKDNIKVINTKVIDEPYASDHLPIVAELKL